MFQAYEISYYLYFVVLGLSIWYLYKAIRQMTTKEMEFFKMEIYTDESVRKWAVVDGFLKIATALTFAAYGALGLAGINMLYVAIAVLVVLVVLYFVLYSKTLKKKEDC